jgi:hypothetical protein
MFQRRCHDHPHPRGLSWARALGAFVCVLVTVAASHADAQATDWPTTAAQGSTELWSAASLYDKNPASVWSSTTHGTPSATEWLAFWMAETRPVNYVKLGTRFHNGRALGFPTDFEIRTASAGVWKLAHVVQAYVEPASDSVTLYLPETVDANAVWIIARGLGRDDQGNYVFQLSEASAGHDPTLAMPLPTPAVAVASSSVWPAANVLDGSPSSCWSSQARANTTDTEYMSLNFATANWMNHVKLLPRDGMLGYPRSFRIYYYGGSQWFEVPILPGRATSSGWQVIPFQAPVYTTSLVLIATTLGKDDHGNNYFQLAEARAGYHAAFQQGVEPCPVAGADITVTRSTKLNPLCRYDNVTIVIPSSNVTLDCNDATLTGTWDPKRSDREQRPDAKKYGVVVQGPLSDVTIKNCRIRNYRFGLIVRAAETPKELQLEAFRTFGQSLDPKPYLRNLQNTAPRRVTISHTTISSVAHGAYIYPGSTYVSILDSSFSECAQLGVYLDAAANNATIKRTRFFNTAMSRREAIAIDASAYHVIEGNTIEGQWTGGINLYKNCGEAFKPRLQPAERNHIVGNKFKNLSWGVRIASRADKLQHNFFGDREIVGTRMHPGLALPYPVYEATLAEFESNGDMPIEHSWFCLDPMYGPAPTAEELGSKTDDQWSQMASDIVLGHDYAAYIRDDVLPDARYYRYVYYRDRAPNNVVRCNSFCNIGDSAKDESGSPTITVQDDNTLVQNNLFSRRGSIEVGSTSRSRQQSAWFGTNPLPLEPVSGTNVIGNKLDGVSLGHSIKRGATYTWASSYLDVSRWGVSRTCETAPPSCD